MPHALDWTPAWAKQFREMYMHSSNEHLDPVLIGQRLTQARKARGVTQQEAAEYLGVSRPTLLAIEKGTRAAKPDELIKLAALYGRNLHEIVRPGEESVPIEPHLRAALSPAAGSTEELNQAIAELQRFVEDYRQLEQLTGAKPFERYPPTVDLPQRVEVGEFSEDLAIRERARLHLGDQPVLNLREVLEEGTGLRIFYGAIPSTIAGMYAFVADFGYCILINRKHPPERRRWTLAHEYLHFLTERYKPGIDYLAGGERKPLSERCADAFAASFLMPKTGVRRHFLDVIDRRDDFQVADLCHLSNIYFVSVHAMTLRLESLGLIKKGTWDLLEEKRFRPEIARQRLGLSTPQRRPEAPYPERFKFLAVSAFCQEKISEGQLARFLRCDRVSAREIVADCLNRLDDVDEQGNERPLTLPFEQSLLEA